MARTHAVLRRVYRRGKLAPWPYDALLEERAGFRRCGRIAPGIRRCGRSLPRGFTPLTQRSHPLGRETRKPPKLRSRLPVGVKRTCGPLLRCPANASGKALTPSVRITRSMKNSVDCHELARPFVEYCIRESAREGSTKVFVNDRMHIGVSPNARQARVNGTQELLTQAVSAALVPGVGF